MTPEQFETEGRGDAWVQRGRLMVRPQGQTYSPNYPKQPTPGDGRLTQLGNWAVDSPNYPKQPTAKAGDRVVGRPNGEGVECNTNDCWRLQPQPISVNGLRSVNGQPQPISGSTVLRLLGVSASLCLTAVDGGAISPSNLTVDLCATSATTQEFVTTNQEFVTTTQEFVTTNHTAATAVSPTAVSPTAVSPTAVSPTAASAAGTAAAIKHVPSGQCVTAADASCPDCPAALQTCSQSLAARQVWVFGASGRLCATSYNSLCLHADAHWPAWWQMKRP